MYELWDATRDWCERTAHNLRHRRAAAAEQLEALEDASHWQHVRAGWWLEDGLTFPHWGST
jgi:hypothetical protein